MSKLLQELNTRYRQIKRAEWLALMEEFSTLEGDRDRLSRELEKLTFEQLKNQIVCSRFHADSGRILTWMQSPKRKAAFLAFTAGPEREIAYEFERVMGVKIK